MLFNISYKMLITAEQVTEILKCFDIPITGVLHVGAHDCEEMGFYKMLGLTPNDVVWIDALPSKVSSAKDRGIPNIYHAVVTDKDDDVVKFNITNNYQSSSVLDLGSHSQHHPEVVVTNTLEQKTTTLSTFFKTNAIDPSKLNFWNLDIQGAELLALKGGEDALKHVRALYLEVNTEEVYRGCGLIGDIDKFLAGHGFKQHSNVITPWGWGDALYLKF